MFGSTGCAFSVYFDQQRIEGEDERVCSACYVKGRCQTRGVRCAGRCACWSLRSAERMSDEEIVILRTRDSGNSRGVGVEHEEAENEEFLQHHACEEGILNPSALWNFRY